MEERKKEEEKQDEEGKGNSKGIKAEVGEEKKKEMKIKKIKMKVTS